MPEGELPEDAAQLPAPVRDAISADTAAPEEAAPGVAAVTPEAATPVTEPTAPAPVTEPTAPEEVAILLPRVGWAISTKPGYLAAPVAPGTHRSRRRPRLIPRGVPGRRRLVFSTIAAIAVVGVAAGSFVVVRGTAGVAASPTLSAADAARTAGGTATTSPKPTPTLPGISASSSFGATAGTVYFSDRFGSQYSGWPTDLTANLQHTTLQFDNRGYEIGSLGGAMHHLVYGPSRVEKQQMSMSLTATQENSPLGAGFGVSCRRGTDADQVVYEFIVTNAGRFLVDRWTGTPTVDGEAAPLQHGDAPYPPSIVPITVTGVCATMSDGITTRLALFVDGRLLVDFADRVRLSGAGWSGGIVMSSLEAPSTMIATYFEERDLTK